MEEEPDHIPTDRCLTESVALSDTWRIRRLPFSRGRLGHQLSRIVTKVGQGLKSGRKQLPVIAYFQNRDAVDALIPL